MSAVREALEQSRLNLRHSVGCQSHWSGLQHCNCPSRQLIDKIDAALAPQEDDAATEGGRRECMELREKVARLLWSADDASIETPFGDLMCGPVLGNLYDLADQLLAIPEIADALKLVPVKPLSLEKRDG